jgi:chemotaxis protein MotB
LAEADAELTAMTLALEEQRQQAEDTLTLLAAAEALGNSLAEQLAQAVLASDGNQDQAAAAAAQRDAALARIGELETAQASLKENLRQALAAELAARNQAAEQLSAKEQRDALLAAANLALAEEEAKSAESLREVAALREQVSALRSELGSLQDLLDASNERDQASNVEIQALGSKLNAALARVASEERRRRQLEEAERLRLEAEAQDLERYRSEFFGQLRDILGNQEGVQIVGDRFVFSSEVLFPPARAALSAEGEAEIAKVARVLQGVIGDIPRNIDWVIQVDGHTDNTPLSGAGEFANNWELSQARALSVVLYMSETLGLPPDRLSANGFGEYQPINLGDSAEALAQNRRIELKFTEK